MSKQGFDDLIAEALTEDERRFLADLEEPSMMRQGLELFRGKNHWINVLIAICLPLFLALGVYALVRFLRADDVVGLARWGAVMFYSFLMIFGMKIWGWMEMQSNQVRREVKRVELQLVSLAHRMDE